MKTHLPPNGESFAVIVRKFRTIFGHRNSPGESTVRRLIKKKNKLKNTVRLQDIEIPGRHRNGRGEAYVAVVRDSVPRESREIISPSCTRNAHDNSNNAKNINERSELIPVPRAVNTGI